MMSWHSQRSRKFPLREGRWVLAVIPLAISSGSGGRSLGTSFSFGSKGRLPYPTVFMLLTLCVAATFVCVPSEALADDRGLRARLPESVSFAPFGSKVFLSFFRENLSSPLIPGGEEAAKAL